MESFGQNDIVSNEGSCHDLKEKSMDCYWSNHILYYTDYNQKSLKMLIYVENDCESHYSLISFHLKKEKYPLLCFFISAMINEQSFKLSNLKEKYLRWYYVHKLPVDCTKHLFLFLRVL